MREKKLCVALIKCITEVFLNYAQNQAEVLKIITIGVQAALKANKDKKS